MARMRGYTCAVLYIQIHAYGWHSRQPKDVIHGFPFAFDIDAVIQFCMINARIYITLGMVSTIHSTDFT